MDPVELTDALRAMAERLEGDLPGVSFARFEIHIAGVRLHLFMRRGDQWLNAAHIVPWEELLYTRLGPTAVLDHALDRLLVTAQAGAA